MPIRSRLHLEEFAMRRKMYMYKKRKKTQDTAEMVIIEDEVVSTYCWLGKVTFEIWWLAGYSLLCIEARFLNCGRAATRPDAWQSRSCVESKRGYRM